MGVLQIAGLVALGLIPSFFWVFLYLREDSHPEPMRLVRKVFIIGMLTAPFVIIFQMLPSCLAGSCSDRVLLGSSPFMLWAAFVEEFFKFLVIWVFLRNNPEFDEPVDAMIYMIVAGLGFAAVENMLFLYAASPKGLDYTLSTWAYRFIGSTFLHALAAGLTGYFMAMAWFYCKHLYKLIFLGLILATLFHFTFNVIIIQSSLTPFCLSSGLCLPASVAGSSSLLLLFALLLGLLFHQLWKRQQQHIESCPV